MTSHHAKDQSCETNKSLEKLWGGVWSHAGRLFFFLTSGGGATRPGGRAGGRTHKSGKLNTKNKTQNTKQNSCGFDTFIFFFSSKTHISTKLIHTLISTEQ